MQQTVDNKEQIEDLVPKIKSMMDSFLTTSNDKENLAVTKYTQRETSRRREFRRLVVISARSVYTSLMFEYVGHLTKLVRNLKHYHIQMLSSNS